MSTSGEAAALDIGARQKARHYAVQALYQHILTQDSAAKIEAECRVDYDMSAVDLAYFRELLASVIAKTAELDALFDQYLDRDIAELYPVSLAQLRLSTDDMQSRVDSLMNYIYAEMLSILITVDHELTY